MSPGPETGIRPPEADSLVETAKEVLAVGDDLQIVGYFDSSCISHPLSGLDAAELFKLGRAYFLTAFNEIELSRGENHPGMGSLPERTVKMLVTARDNLQAAADRDPGKDFAPEAYYLAARSMDHGYLQDFHKAMELYQWAARTYPGSEFGQKAADRYLDLRDRFGIK